MKNITTLILAAGKSSRFQSSKSKIFNELAGRELIDYVYSVAKKISEKDNDIVIIANPKNYKLLKNKYQDCHIAVQKNQKGTADAVNAAKKFISKQNNLLILFGDVPLIKSSSLKKLIKNNIGSKSAGAMLTFTAKNPYGYGRVETSGKKVLRVTEEIHANKKTKTISLCNSGILFTSYKFLFSRIKFISNKNIKKEKYLTDIFKIADNYNENFAFTKCSEEELLGINKLEDLVNGEKIVQKNLIETMLKNGVNITDPDNIKLSYDTKIGKNSTIEPFVIFKKGVKLGKNILVKSHSVLENCNVNEGSSIGPFARIRPGSLIGKKVKIGNYVEIKNSKIGNSTSISHLSYIGDSIVGSDVNIGAGTITCNFDGKNKNITKIENKVFVGSNCSLIAPIKIGFGSKIGAGSVVSKDIPPKTLVIERSPLKIIKKSSKKS